MDFPIHIDTISISGIVHFALLGVKTRVFWIMVNFCPWRFALILANSAFHQGLQYLQKYLFMGFQYTKGWQIL